MKCKIYMIAVRKTYEIPHGRKTLLKRMLRDKGYSISNHSLYSDEYVIKSGVSSALARMPKMARTITVMDLGTRSVSSDSTSTDRKREREAKALDNMLSRLDFSQ
jgi:hypothetical protein